MTTEPTAAPDTPTDAPVCGAPHATYTETVCTQPPHQTGPHGGPLIVDGRVCGGASWGRDATPDRTETGPTTPTVQAAGPGAGDTPADTDPVLRKALAAAIHRYDYDHGLSGNPYPSVAHLGEAEAVLAVRDTEMERLRTRLSSTEAERDGWAEALNNLLAIDNPSAAIRRVQAEISRITQLPALDDDQRADSFATGARWTLRLIHNALTQPEPADTEENRS